MSMLLILRWAVAIICLGGVSAAGAETIEISPEQGGREFEQIANGLKPGDELILHEGKYPQSERLAITAQGTPEEPIVIRAAVGEVPLITRSDDQMNRYNNIEFVDCAHLVIRGLRFRGGSSGVRFIRGSHVTFEQCEISHTGNNALTMNSGDCHAFVVRNNHIHHTGLSRAGPTEGEGMYIGCNRDGCRTTDSVFEGNYIHHLRGTSAGGNDGIEIKVGSYGNVVRSNRIHHTTIGRDYPGIFVYGGGPKPNIVEGNVIWNAGEGIQVVSDAVVRNNFIFDCSVRGITAAPHAQVDRIQGVSIVNNTIVNQPEGVRLRWEHGSDVSFKSNVIYCPDATALNADKIPSGAFGSNFVAGKVKGISPDHEGLTEVSTNAMPGADFGAPVAPGEEGR